MTRKARSLRKKNTLICFLIHWSWKNFAQQHNFVSMVKRHVRNWEVMFINHISDRGFVSRIEKVLLKLNNYIPDNKNLPSQKYLYTLKYNAYICNSKILKIIQMSVNVWMVKQTLLHPYNWILLNKKELSIDT